MKQLPNITETAILITGASSGIGAAVAEEWARRGAKALFICGRDRTRLDDVAERCRTAGAKFVQADIVDVTDAEATAKWIAECDAVHPIGTVFANAGRGTGRETSESVRQTFALNAGGVLNTVLPAIDIFRSRGNGGRIAITASIAGYIPLPTCPSYAATKAAMKSWGLSLRGFLRRDGIRVNVICPGFVRSRITERNTCPMPFFMEAPKAARIIADRVERNVGLIAFPWPMRLAVWFMSAMPWRISEFIGRILPEKNADNRTTDATGQGEIAF